MTTQHTAIRCPACGGDRIQTGEMIVVVPLRIFHEIGLCLNPDCNTWLIHDGRPDSVPEIVMWQELQRMMAEGVVQ